MIDLKLLRRNPELVAKAIRDKGMDVDLDALLLLDARQNALKRSTEEIREARNKLSHSMKSGAVDAEAVARSKALRDELAKLEAELETTVAAFETLYKKVPNIPTSDTPIGASESDNVVANVWGEPTKFAFPARNHFEIASHRGWIDKDRAAKVAGARFAYVRGDLVMLQFALIQWVLDQLTDERFLDAIVREEGLEVSTKPFTPILPPYMLRTALYDAMDRLEPSDERYRIEGEDLWLQGSAEHVLGSMHADEIFDETEMPVRYLGYATSFRREAGAAGKDMEGIVRLHQFDKLEMESFATAETAHEEHLLFSAIQERLMQGLAIPYRKLQKCTFDIGKPNAKGSDIEAWLPGQNKYRETHTADYMTDYQARRLKTRVRRSNRSIELVHTNDATAFACGRTMVAIIENYQNEDMTVRIPDPLRRYLRDRDVL
jgi:seryl-tRNA synthetase